MANINKKSRVSEERIVLNDNVDGAFFIPAELKNPDYDYRWVREFVDGAYDEPNMYDAEHKSKWEPVFAEEMVSLTKVSKIDDRNIESKYIRRLGHILMKRPRDLSRKVTEELRELNKQKLNAASFIKNVSGAEMPGYIEEDKESYSVKKPVSFQE